MANRGLVTGFLVGVLAGGPACANPTGAQVVRGNVQFDRPDPYTLNVHNSPSAIVNWQSFSIGAQETTRFIQQSATSAILNRVTSQHPSEIFGRMLSNGRVFLINPNGVVFGESAVVDTAGFLATTLQMTDEDFLAGRLHFEAPDAGHIENRGYIKAGPGGEVVLIAPTLENSGIIEAPGGKIILAAGRKVTIASLDLEGIEFEVQAPDDAVVNLGQLIAERGAVGVFADTIESTGVVRADSISTDAAGNVVLSASGDIDLGTTSVVSAAGGRGGDIRIESATGTTMVAGVVDASGDAGAGGNVALLGRRVGVHDGAAVDASGTTGGGRILVGGDFRGANPDVSNAEATYVGPDVTLAADATEAGDGGEVIVWSDDATRFYGHASVRGGPHGGEGGLVETSGKEWLDFHGTADRTAPAGEAGTLLLDPKFIVIGPGPGSPPANDLLFGTNLGGTSNLTDDEVEGALASGNLILQAGTDITLQTGADIVVVAGGSGGNLTLQAGRSILLNSDIVTDNGSLFITANDATVPPPEIDRTAGPAEIKMADGTKLDAGTGNISIFMREGAGPDYSTGDIVLETLIGTDMLIVHNGDEDSDILRASADALWSGNSLGIDHNPCLVPGTCTTGTDGSIGTAAAPIRIDFKIFAARTTGPSIAGINVDSPLGGVDLGIPILGGYGVETVKGGPINIAAAGPVTTNAPVYTGTSSGTGDADVTGTSITLGGDGADWIIKGTANLTATAGDISDGTPGSGGIIIYANALSMSATGGIDMSTSVGDVAAASTVAGDIRIDNFGTDLMVNTVGSVVGVSTTASDVYIENDQKVVIGDANVTAGSGGKITIISNSDDVDSADMGALITSGDVFVSADGEIGRGERLHIDAGGVVTLETFGGDAIVQSDSAIRFGSVTPLGNFDLVTLGPVSSDGTPVLIPGTTVIVAGSNDVAFDAPGSNFVGTVSVSSANDATFHDVDSIDFGTVTIAGLLTSLSATGFDNSGSIDAGAVDVTVSGAGSLLNVSSGIIATADSVHLRADRMDIAANLSAANKVVLTPNDVTREVHLGPIGNTGPALELSSAELNQVVGGDLCVGDFGQVGAIRTTSLVNYTGPGPLHLVNSVGGIDFGSTGDLTSLSAPVFLDADYDNTGTGAITQTGIISAATVDARAATGVGLGSSTNFINNFTATNTTAGNITFTNGTGLTVGPTGIENFATTGGASVFINNVGAIVISGPIKAHDPTGSVGIDSGGPGTITGPGLVTADTINLQIGFGTGQIGALGTPLNTASLGATTDLQVGDDATTAASGAYLNHAGNVVVGEVFLASPFELKATGDIDVPIGPFPAFDTNGGLLKLESTGGVVTVDRNLNGGDVTLSGANGLNVFANVAGAGFVNLDGGNGGLLVDTAAVSGGNTVNLFGNTLVVNGTSVSSGSGDVNLDSATDIQVTGFSSVSSFSGQVSLNGASGVQVTGSSSVSSSTGSVSIDGGSGQLLMGNASVSTSSGDVNLDGDTLLVDGSSVSSSDGALTFNGTNGIDLINSTFVGSSTGDVSLDGGNGMLLADSAYVSAGGLLDLSSDQICIYDSTLQGNDIDISSVSLLELTAGVTNTLVSATNNLFVSGGDVLLQGGAGFAESVVMQADGTIDIAGTSLTLLGGSDINAFVAIDPTVLNINVANDVQVQGGNAVGTFALLEGDSVNIVAGGDVLISGGTAQGTYGMVRSLVGDIAITAGTTTAPGTISLTQGTAIDADAIIDAADGTGIVTLAAGEGQCINCVLIDPPRPVVSNSQTEQGIIAAELIINVLAPPPPVAPPTGGTEVIGDGDGDNLPTDPVVVLFDEQGNLLEINQNGIEPAGEDEDAGNAGQLVCS